MSRVAVIINNVHVCNVERDLVRVDGPIKSDLALPLTTLNAIQALLEGDSMVFEAETIIATVKFIETIPYTDLLGDRVFTCDIRFNLFTTNVINFLTEDDSDDTRLGNFLRDRMWKLLKGIVEGNNPNITIPFANDNPAKFKFANRLLNETQFGFERVVNVIDFDSDISELEVCAERKDVKYYSVPDAPMLDIGKAAFVSVEEAHKRFRELTLGIIEPRDLAHACVAGGGIMKCLSAKHNIKGMPRSDVDIFVYGGDRERSQRVIGDLLNKFAKLGDVYFGIIGSVITVFIKDYPRIFQIISINCRNHEEVITRFDLTHIQMCVVGINGEFRFKATLPAIYAHMTGTASPANISHLRADRVIKACLLGFRVVKSPRLGSIESQTNAILSDPSAFENCRNTLYAQYLPQSIPEISPNEERNYICSMISKTGDKKYAYVSQSVQFVRDNVTYEGDFSASYDGLNIETFRMDQIDTRTTHYALDKKLRYAATRKEIKLLSDEMEVESVHENDEGLRIVLKASDKFVEFGNRLNAEIYPKIDPWARQQPAHKNVRDGKYTVNFPMEVVESGKPPLRNTRGTIITREHIQPSNKVKLLFYMTVTTARGNSTGIHIKTKCVIRTDMNDDKVVLLPEQAQMEKKLELGSVTGIDIKYDSDEDE
ncbi:ankyrin repeat domain-containing protein [Faustovirus]|nr:hypothetical protein F-LCD7_0058 [Faustovirus]QJX71822.1 ankyrin repeat domain-containing protein [Faustovirus]QJX73832.1 hypothetical protein F-E9_59 [Faustovirus]